MWIPAPGGRLSTTADCAPQALSLQSAAGVRAALCCSTTVSQVAPPHVEAAKGIPAKSGQVAAHQVCSGAPGESAQALCRIPPPALRLTALNDPVSDEIRVTAPPPIGRCWKWIVAAPPAPHAERTR